MNIRKSAAVSALWVILLVSTPALSAPEKVREYWPVKPGEFSLPSRVHSPGKNIQNPESVLAEDDQYAILPQGADLVVDFGAGVGGFFELKLNLGKPAKIRLSYSEAAEFVRGYHGFFSPGPGSYMKFLQRTYQVENSGWFKDPALMGAARYLRIQVLSGAIELDAVRCQNTFLQCDPLTTGWFLSNDEMINRIWYASFYTLCLDTIHSDQGGKLGKQKIGEGEWVIVDGAKRDRLIWSGDMGIAGRTGYNTNGRYDVARDTLLSLAHWQFPNGLYPACSRAELGTFASKQFIEYSIWQVVNSYEYFLFSGDREFLKEIYPGMIKAMDYHDSRTNADGMIIQNPLRAGLNYSYSIFRSGPVAYLNALYYIALDDAAKMAVAMKDFGQAQVFLGRSDKLKQNFNPYFWDKRKRAYKDTRYDATHHALDGNSFAVLAGLAGQEQAENVIDFFDSELALKWGDRQFDAPYFFPQKIPFAPGHNDRYVMAFMDAFDVLARYRAGRDDTAIDLVRRCWGNMVDQDPNFTTWEWTGKRGKPDSPMTSLAHAWSAGASFILSEFVLGVRPLEAGYASYAIEPHASGLAWVKGAVPSPRGLIEASWKDAPDNFEMELNLPPGRGPRVSLLRKGEKFKVSLDGEIIFEQGRAASNPKLEGSGLDEKYVSFELKAGGSYKFVVESVKGAGQ